MSDGLADLGEPVERSRRAAALYARQPAGAGYPRFRWTPANLLRLALLLVVPVAVVTGLMHRGWQEGRDEAESRMVVEQWFEAIRRGDAVAGYATPCSGDPAPYGDWQPPSVADAFGADSIADNGVEIEWHVDLSSTIRHHDVEVPGRALATVELNATDDPERPWEVCGLLSSVTFLSPD